MERKINFHSPFFFKLIHDRIKLIKITIPENRVSIFAWFFTRKQYHGTTLLNELQIKVSRVNAAFRYKFEVNYATFIQK